MHSFYWSNHLKKFKENFREKLEVMWIIYSRDINPVEFKFEYRIRLLFLLLLHFVFATILCTIWGGIKIFWDSRATGPVAFAVRPSLDSEKDDELAFGQAASPLPVVEMTVSSTVNLRVVPVRPSFITGDDPGHEGRVIHDTLFRLLSSYSDVLPCHSEHLEQLIAASS